MHNDLEMEGHLFFFSTMIKLLKINHHPVTQSHVPGIDPSAGGNIAVIPEKQIFHQIPPVIQYLIIIIWQMKSPVFP